jgi:hypothetical protein
MKTNQTAYRSAIRIVVGTAVILLLPLLAMQFTGDVVWTLLDFVTAGALLVAAGLTYELGARKAGNNVYRAGVGVAVLTVLFLVWSSLAVGLIGAEGDPADLMYAGVIAVLIVGSVIARFEPRGMARVLLATAVAQALVAVMALIAGKQHSPDGSLYQILGVNGMFIVLFLGSALLFRYSAEGHLSAPPSSAP